jgi:hypothetical protein
MPWKQNVLVHCLLLSENTRDWEIYKQHRFIQLTVPQAGKSKTDFCVWRKPSCCIIPWQKVRSQKSKCMKGSWLNLTSYEEPF